MSACPLLGGSKPLHLQIVEHCLLVSQSPSRSFREAFTSRFWLPRSGQLQMSRAACLCSLSHFAGIELGGERFLGSLVRTGFELGRLRHAPPPPLRSGVMPSGSSRSLVPPPSTQTRARPTRPPTHPPTHLRGEVASAAAARPPVPPPPPAAAGGGAEPASPPASRLMGSDSADWAAKAKERWRAGAPTPPHVSARASWASASASRSSFEATDADAAREAATMWRVRAARLVAAWGARDRRGRSALATRQRPSCVGMPTRGGGSGGCVREADACRPAMSIRQMCRVMLL